MEELEGGGSMAVAIGVTDRWQVTRDMWHVKRYMWHLTHNFFFFFSSCPLLSVLVSVLLCAQVERFSVSCMRYFWWKLNFWLGIYDIVKGVDFAKGWSYHKKGLLPTGLSLLVSVWLAVWFACWLASSLAALHACGLTLVWLFGWLDYWLAGLLAGWLAGWLAGLYPSWLPGWLTVRHQPGQPSISLSTYWQQCSS